MRASITFVFFFLFSGACLNVSLAGFVPSELYGSPTHSKHNPGGRFRITNEGVQYLIDFLGQITTEVLSTLEIDKMELKTAKPFEGLTILRNLQVAEFHPPEYVGTLQDGSLELEVKDLKKVRLKSDVETNLLKGKVQVSGPLESEFIDFNAKAKLQINTESSTLLPKLDVSDCSVEIGSFSLDISKLTGKGEDLLEDLKKIIEYIGKNLIAEEICNKVKMSLVGSMNKHFRSMVTNIALDGSLAPGLENSIRESKTTELTEKEREIIESVGIEPSSLKEIMLIPLSEYMLDYRYNDKNQATITPTHMQSDHKGGIRHRNDKGKKNKAPFYPPEIPPMSAKLQNADEENPHVLMQFSDYIVNTLMYQLRSRKILKWSVPTLNGGFISHQTSGNADMPYIRMHHNGDITLYIEGEVHAKNLGGEFNDAKAFKAKTHLKGLVQLHVDPETNQVYGTVTFDEIDFRSIKGDEANSELVKKLLETISRVYISDLLYRAIPLPVSEYGQFEKTAVLVKRNHVLVASDILLNHDAILQISRELVKKSFSQK